MWKKRKAGQQHQSATESTCLLEQVAAGTAAFFQLRLRPEWREDESATYWIGKALGRAADEALFYERAQLLQQEPGWAVRTRSGTAENR